MKPPRFDYVAPASLDEALEVLAERGEAAKVLAGGQSLMPLLGFRLASPEILVDLNGLDDLAYLRAKGDVDVLAIGAMTRHRTVERTPEVMGRAGMIADAVPLIGHTAIRNRGTVGGSIAHADPAAEWPAIALALDAEVDVARSDGVRTIGIGDLIQAQFTTTLQPDEILTEIRFRMPRPGAGSAFLEFARRHGDFALAGAAVVLSLADGAVADARIALMGVAATPVRALDAERLLVGAEATDELFERAAAAIDPVMSPVSDVHATADFRRHLARVMVRRALSTAGSRARGGE